MRFLAGHGFKLLLGGRRLPDGAAFQRALAIDFGRRGIYLRNTRMLAENRLQRGRRNDAEISRTFDASA